MSAHYDRAVLLYRQQRHDLAERSFRDAIAEEPDNLGAYAFLSIVLAAQDRGAEALAVADDALGLDPAHGFPRYARALALSSLNRDAEALREIEAAIEFDPEEKLYHNLAGRIHYDLRHWDDALAFAERALAIDPEYASAANLRALALGQLGRTEERFEALGAALALDPENAEGHETLGWALLERGDREQAMQHFREALRRDPTRDSARKGIVETLKANYRIYALFLRYVFWTQRLSPRAYWLFLVAVYGLPRFLRFAPRQWQGIALPIAMVFILLGLTRMFVGPVLTATLRFTALGRLALSDEERRESTVQMAGFAVAVLAGIGAAVTGDMRLAAIGVLAFLLLFPISIAMQARDGWPRRLLTVHIAVLGAGGLAWALLALPARGGAPQSAMGSAALAALAIAFVAPLVLIRVLRQRML